MGCPSVHSSYQIDYSKIFKTNYGIILNISPDHLERHGSLKNCINAKFKLLKETGLIVLHRHKKTKDDFGNEFAINRSTKYGISKIIFLKKLIK